MSLLEVDDGAITDAVRRPALWRLRIPPVIVLILRIIHKRQVDVMVL